MFDIGWTELVVIGVVALIVIGPKELPGVLRMLGQWMGKVRRMAADFQGQFNEAMREAEMADLKKHVDEIADSARDLTSDFDPIGSLDIDDPFDEGGDTSKAGKRKTASEAGADADPDAVGASKDVPSAEPARAGPQAEPASTAEVPQPHPAEGSGTNSETPSPQKAAAGGHSG